MIKHYQNRRVADEHGITLLEILIVAAIVVILSLVAANFYRTYVKNVELDTLSKSMASALKGARTRSVSGEDAYKWGIHLVNSTSTTADYYELFETPTTYSSASTTVKETTYFSGGITFTDPADGITKDIIFDRIAGTVTANASTTITFEGKTKTITVTTLGSVY